MRLLLALCVLSALPPSTEKTLWASRAIRSHVDRGAALMNRHRYRDAVIHFLKVDDLATRFPTAPMARPGRAEAYASRGVIYAVAGSFDEADRMIRQLRAMFAPPRYEREIRRAIAVARQAREAGP